MKKSVVSVLVFTWFFFVFPAATTAQNKPDPVKAGSIQGGNISGVLADSVTGKPIEYATVSLLWKGASQSVNGTLTDEKGRFSFTNTGIGNYELAITYLGYEPKTIRGISLSEGKAAVILGTIGLKPSSTSLKAVTVEALRPTITMEADKMVVSIEGTALAAGKTAYDVLATSPGVFIDQEGNIQLNGRPGVTVMLDGKQTYLSARDLRTLLEGMPAENLKNIEIITNPSAKYDAEGASGILNINLKKNLQEGMNGSVYTGYNYNGKQHGYSAGTNINYKSGPWNSFLLLDFSRRVGGREATFTRVFAGETTTTYFDQVATGNFAVQGPPAVRLGSDYNLNERNSIGFMAYFVTNKASSDFLTETYIGYAPGQPKQYIDADNFNTNRYTNYTTNLHYQRKIDTLGTTLSADLDYVNIRNRGEAFFYNSFRNLAIVRPDSNSSLYTDTPNGFDIYAAKTDYSRPLPNGRKLEAGAKVSRVISDNDSRFYFNDGELPVLDPARTNHFIYHENIFAGYVNLNSKLGDNFTVQAGLRAEHTLSRGRLVGASGRVTDRSYFNLFPSLFVQQKVTENYQVNYNYSRRIQRPNYGQLNPSYFYRDPYTYWLGNPYLRSQYTHSVGATQVFKKNYSLVLNYQHNQDVIAELPAIDAATATTIYYIGNADKSQSLGLTAIVPVKIMKKWDTNNTLLVSYNEYTTIVDNRPVLADQVFYMLQSNHNILLPHNLKLELFGNYQGKSVYALYTVDPRWWVNIGLKKSFLDDKLDVSLNVNDVFKSQRLIIAANVGEGNVSDFDQYFRQQNIGISVRYKFNKGEKFESKRRSTNLEELNRAGG